jgi:hypothetical protein
MKRIFALLLTAALCLSFAACAAKDAPAGPEEPDPAPSQPADPAPMSQPEPVKEPEPEPEPDYALCISDQPIPTVDGCLVTDRLPVHLINNTGKDALVLLIPHLERRNEAGGWEEVPYKEDVGFCGTPDPLPPEGKDGSEDLLYLWGTLEDGDYRLSYEVGDTFDTEDMAYGEFTLYTPEDNQGLPLSSGEVSQNGED